MPDLYDAIMEGAVERVRPKMMTVSAIMAGLLPILWSTGTGSEVLQRIAVPMVGGMISSTLPRSSSFRPSTRWSRALPSEKLRANRVFPTLDIRRKAVACPESGPIVSWRRLCRRGQPVCLRVRTPDAILPDQ